MQLYIQGSKTFTNALENGDVRYTYITFSFLFFSSVAIKWGSLKYPV